ncbi:MAG TPA: adenylate/guanylate cyclase domain-containing protein [Kofleriaceae bacterium]|nr:adenylate/guanylate cyclase domain-containing protein [Kofleriaceae bacterium]
MLRALTRRMVAKIFFAIGVAVGSALLLQAWVDARRTARGLEMNTRDSANQLAGLMVGGIEHAMLDGDGIKVKSLVADLKSRLGGATVSIFDQRGVEVFGPKPPPPAVVPPLVARAMTEAVVQRDPQGGAVRPVRADDRCASCHREQDSAARYPRVRGALRLALDPEVCATRRDDVLVRLVHDGFTHVMTAKQTDLLDGYFAELQAAAPGLRAITVYDADTDLAFGAELDGLESDALVAAMAAPSQPTVRALPASAGSGVLALVPLLMSDRCVACHDDAPGAVRGVLAVSLGPAATPRECDEEELARVIDTSLRTIMVSALGRRISDFLDDASATGAVREMTLFDNDGRTYWSTARPDPPAQVGRVLATGVPLVEFQGSGAGEQVLVVQPLPNKPGCRQCHGSATALRGAVSVALSTADAARARDRRMRESYWFTGTTLAGILLILLALLQYFVVRPVNAIGEVADQIGEGNLTVEVPRADPNGDEIRRLGTRINQMVRGLRAKMHLEKFVSRGTAAAAHGADAQGVSRMGVMQQVTVLFSDIRGFTAFAEERDPQDVVSMLNHLLQAQAELVGSFDGDIDKYVGDELMAVFHGEGADLRATRCALALVEAVDRAGLHGLRIGVGVNSGEAVHGAIGHDERMDFTVIGDVVNTGARLCGVAAAGEVIVSQAVVTSCAGTDELTFTELAPVALKGKRRPFALFRAARSG